MDWQQIKVDFVYLIAHHVALSSGFAMALFAGMMFGHTFVPAIYVQSRYPGASQDGHFSLIFVPFVIACAKGWKPPDFTQFGIRPTRIPILRVNPVSLESQKNTSQSSYLEWERNFEKNIIRSLLK